MSAAEQDPRAEQPILSVNNIEVIYDHVILVLKGVSLEVPRGGIVAIDADGNFAFPFSSEGMVRGYASPDVAWSVGVFDTMETQVAD